MSGIEVFIVFSVAAFYFAIVPGSIGTDQLDIFGSMLVGMVMRPAGEIAQGLDGTVKASFSAVNIL